MKSNKVVLEIIDWLKALLIAFIVVFIINQFVLFAKIDGRSMEPTLHDGDHVITARRFTTYEKNDIIAFNFVDSAGEESFHVKRIVGMPGDNVKVDGKQILVNDEVVIDDGIIDYGTQEYNLSSTQYFVVGDNYEVSYDSRIHGPIEEEAIVGEIIVELPF